MGQEVTKDRQQLRVSVALTARFSGASETRQHEGVCQNLSRMGLFLGTPHPAGVGARLEIDCELVEGTGRIRGVARVMWVRHEASGAGRPAGMGLRFLSLEPGSDALIEDLLARGDIGSSSRRARSDPPDQRPDSQRPKLVAVATIHEVRTPNTIGKTPSSNPPSGRGSRDASELRERWQTLRKTRREFAAGSLEASASSAPPPAAGVEESGSQLLPPPASARPESRATEPEGQSRVTEPGAPSFHSRESREGSPSHETDEADDDLDDPEWRAKRLAELVESEAEKQRSGRAGEINGTSSRPSVEDGVLVTGTPALQLPGALLVRLAVGLLIVAGVSALVLMRRSQHSAPVPAETAVTRLVAAAPARAPQPVIASPPRPPRAPILPSPVSTPAPRMAPVEVARDGASEPSSGSSRTSPEASRTSSSRSRASTDRSAARPGTTDAPPAPAPEAEPVPSVADDAESAVTPLEAALDCLESGDSACAVKVLEGKAQSAREWELLVESYRALGNTNAAEERMGVYLQRFPTGELSKTYRRLLQYRHPAEAPPPPPAE